MRQVPLCQQRSAFVWLHRRDTFDRADDQRFMGMPSTMRLIDESSGRRLIKVSLIAMAREIKVTFRMLMLIAPGQQCPVDSQLIIAFARCWHTKTCQNWVATKVETTFASLLFFRGPPINLDLPYSDSGPSEAKIINYMQIIIFMQCSFSQPWEPRGLAIKTHLHKRLRRRARPPKWFYDGFDCTDVEMHHQRRTTNMKNYLFPLAWGRKKGCLHRSLRCEGVRRRANR